MSFSRANAKLPRATWIVLRLLLGAAAGEMALVQGLELTRAASEQNLKRWRRLERRAALLEGAAMCHETNLRLGGGRRSSPRSLESAVRRYRSLANGLRSRADLLALESASIESEWSVLTRSSAHIDAAKRKVPTVLVAFLAAWLLVHRAYGHVWSALPLGLALLLQPVLVVALVSALCRGVLQFERLRAREPGLLTPPGHEWRSVIALFARKHRTLVFDPLLADELDDWAAAAHAGDWHQASVVKWRASFLILSAMAGLARGWLVSMFWR